MAVSASSTTAAYEEGGFLAALTRAAAHTSGGISIADREGGRSVARVLDDAEVRAGEIASDAGGGLLGGLPDAVGGLRDGIRVAGLFGWAAIALAVALVLGMLVWGIREVRKAWQS